MKNKGLFILLTAAFMTACSDEMEYIYDDASKNVSMATRSSANDSVDLGELVCLEETDELRALKKWYEAMHANDINTISSSQDEFFSSNIYAIRELPITIQVRTSADGTASDYTYLRCDGAGKEVTLSNISSGTASQFYLRILPSYYGIPYLIYSNFSKTPLAVGYYTNTPNNKILMSAANNEELPYTASWDLIPSSTYKGYFTIESETYLGQYDPDNMWTVFNYVLEAKSNNKVGYGQPVNNKAQQNFLIEPTAEFAITDITFDLEHATVTESTPIIEPYSAKNVDPFAKLEPIVVKKSGIEKSRFIETAGALKLSITASNKTFPRPVPAARKANIFEDTKSDAPYSNVMESFTKEVTFETTMEIKPRSLLELTVKFRTFNLSVPYVATARYTNSDGVREVKVKGTWSGYAIADPKSDLPIVESHFYSLDTGEEINYSLVFDKERNMFKVK